MAEFDIPVLEHDAAWLLQLIEEESQVVKGKHMNDHFDELDKTWKAAQEAVALLGEAIKQQISSSRS